jgi:hypothetical protein
VHLACAVEIDDKRASLLLRWKFTSHDPPPHRPLYHPEFFCCLSCCHCFAHASSRRFLGAYF